MENITPIQEIFYNEKTGSEYVKLNFNLIVSRTVTMDEYLKINEKLTEIIYEVVNGR